MDTISSPAVSEFSPARQTPSHSLPSLGQSPAMGQALGGGPDAQRISAPSTFKGRDGSRNVASDVIHIRKYPNRRLYDTSQSRHLTHDGVIELVNAGKTVQVTDSRSGEDITTIVLLQIMIERSPAKLQAVPAALVHRAMVTDPANLTSIGMRAVEAWFGAAPATRNAPAPLRVSDTFTRPAPASDRVSPSRPVAAVGSNGIAPAPTGSVASSGAATTASPQAPQTPVNGASGRAKAKPKRV